MPIASPRSPTRQGMRKQSLVSDGSGTPIKKTQAKMSETFDIVKEGSDSESGFNGGISNEIH